MSNIKIYTVDFNPSDNVRVESLSTYLNSLTPNFSSDVQYQKLGLDITVKLVSPQLNVMQALGNYAVITQDSKTYYYYVMNANWISKGCVQLVLSIDSINTFWDDINFSSTTHIVRQHKDRWGVTTSTSTSLTLGRIIDNYNEGITPYLKRLTAYPIYNVKLTDSLYNTYYNTQWYLIYRTEYEPSSDRVANPVVLSCVNSKQISLSSTITTKTITAGHLNSAYWYQGLNNYETNCKINLIDGDYPGDYTIGSYMPSGHTDLVCSQIWFRVNSSDTTKIDVQFKYYSTSDGAYQNLTSPQFILNVTVSQIKFLDCNKVYIYTTTPNLFPVNTEGATGTMDIVAGSETVIKSINSIDRTDSKLIKIVEIPYSPFDFSTPSSFTVPTGWSLKSGELVYNQLLDKELTCSLNRDTIANSTSITKAAVLAFHDASKTYESKLWNSDFRTTKYIYGDQSWIYKGENLSNQSSFSTIPVDITYKASKDITSGNGFKFNISSDYKYDEDFGEYLISNRDNQYPIYTSEYINYLNYGKYYDTKSNVISGVSAAGSFAATTGSAIAMMALGATTNTGRIIGLVTSIVAGTISLGTTIANQVNAQNQKEANLRNQAAAVSGSTDRDLFDWQTNNKLYKVTYTPTDEMQNRLWKLFDITGYGCDDYSVPTYNSRYWRNYIQCEAIFDIDGAYLDYKQDIVDRLSKGVTVLHAHNNVYDFDFVKENWEMTVVNAANS